MKICIDDSTSHHLEVFSSSHCTHSTIFYNIWNQTWKKLKTLPVNHSNMQRERKIVYCHFVSFISLYLCSNQLTKKKWCEQNIWTKSEHSVTSFINKQNKKRKKNIGWTVYDREKWVQQLFRQKKKNKQNAMTITFFMVVIICCFNTNKHDAESSRNWEVED